VLPWVGRVIKRTHRGLVDADKKNYELKTMLIDRSVQLLCIISPKGTDESWISKQLQQ